MTLGDFLSAPRAPWDWRTMDCSRWAAAWIVSNGHSDPMAFIRDRYATRIGALRQIRRGGGLVALWSRGMSDIGRYPVSSPSSGDVAVLRVPTDDHAGEGCGIWTGQRWAMLQARGLVFGVGEPLKIWSV